MHVTTQVLDSFFFFSEAFINLNRLKICMDAGILFEMVGFFFPVCQPIARSSQN